MVWRRFYEPATDRFIWVNMTQNSEEEAIDRRESMAAKRRMLT